MHRVRRIDREPDVRHHARALSHPERRRLRPVPPAPHRRLPPVRSQLDERRVLYVAQTRRRKQLLRVASVAGPARAAPRRCAFIPSTCGGRSSAAAKLPSILRRVAKIFPRIHSSYVAPSRACSPVNAYCNRHARSIARRGIYSARRDAGFALISAFPAPHASRLLWSVRKVFTRNPNSR